MKQTVTILFSLLISLGNSFGTTPQPATELFAEVEKSLKTGDVDTLSDWFSDNLDIEILNDSNISSKNQAKQILKRFFAKYTPKNFNFIHKSGSDRVEYGIGTLIAGGESFRITIFIQKVDKKQSISQIRIEKSR